MKKLSYLPVLLGLLFLMGCQTDAVQSTPTEPVLITASPTIAHTPTIEVTLAHEPQINKLQPFIVDISQPLSQDVSLQEWEPQPYSGMDYGLPVDLWRTYNPEVIAGLTGSQQKFLAQNGFVVIHSQEESFLDIRESVSYYQGQPYFLTVDSAYHALHLEFDETLKEIEKILNRKLQGILSAVLGELEGNFVTLDNSSIKEDAELAVQYLYVALRLFAPSTQVPSEYEQLVNEQVDLILAAGGIGDSVIIQNFTDDYGAYRPVGHYVGDPELENYFRGMTWLGRVHFSLEGQSRAPLLITYALRSAEIDGESAQSTWVEIYELIDFLIGPSDDAGPAEYAILMDEVYGTSESIMHIADEDLWDQFLEEADRIPAPQINSTFVDWVSTDMEAEKGWRFLGQRFTLDGLIFQNLIFDLVQVKENGSRRDFPSGLDVMAVFGSESAFKTLEDMGETKYPKYLDQFDMLVDSIEAQSEDQWLNRFYDGWLYSFFPVLAPKDDAFPTFMQTEAWGFKDLNAALGSWAQLKHDTALYTKMPEAAGGGGPPTSGPAPAYVEPNPEAFYRLAYISQQLYDGFSERGYYAYGLDTFNYLSDKFIILGEFAEKELKGEELTEEDFGIIGGCVSSRDCFGTDSDSMQSDLIEVPVIAAVSGARDSVLEVGVGYVDRIYAVVPINGTLQIAQGGVFSYYEFIQPRNDRLTDQDWRTMLREDPPEMPVWADEFIFDDGSAVFSTAFRIGDVYIITEEGDDLLWKETPSIEGDVIGVFYMGDYVEFVDGPVSADGYTWWKVTDAFGFGNDKEEGWIAVEGDWLVRSW